MENSRKRKIESLDLEQEKGIEIPPANLVPETVLKKLPEHVSSELTTLRRVFAGSSITAASAESIAPALLYVDPLRLPGKAHFGVVAQKSFQKGELIAEETSHQGANAVPLDQIEKDPEHFKMMMRLNRSCAPNAIVQFVLVRGEDDGPEAKAIKYLASRDISAGEELCTEYCHMCQSFECRVKLSSFVCNCPVCNLPLEERCASDERREAISKTAESEAGGLQTADNVYSLLCKIKRARQLMLMEKIGHGSIALKLCRLELELLQQTKAFNQMEHMKYEKLLGGSIACWEEAVRRESALCEDFQWVALPDEVVSAINSLRASASAETVEE